MTPKKNFFEYAKELFVALLFALVIATIIRQVWFELYEIPTGSMRPTFKEKDHLTVTKTAFGINFPLQTSHLYFDPNLVLRGGIVIWSGDGVPLLDTESTYFGIFPSVKRYIKRCVGKPGDSLYFYGGRLYGVDSNGNDLTELRETPWMQALEYVPFLGFEGIATAGPSHSILLRQMYQPAGKITLINGGQLGGQLYGEVYNGKEFVKDNPVAQVHPHEQIETYSDILGIRNFAMARLLTKEELKFYPETNIEGLEEGVLYLQLHHTPSLSYPKPIVGRGVVVPAYSTTIPLQQRHLDALMDHLYTTRFVVSNGRAMRYGEHGRAADAPSFSNVKDGTYEFYFGKASKIHFGGISTEVEASNALYSHTPENIQKLFNLGIEMNEAFSPTRGNANLFPHRYAYFREGSLFLMGGQVIGKEDPTLLAFHEREQTRQVNGTAKNPYVAFKDYGPPIKEGKIDASFIRTFGFTIPERQYLVLGDNHAMSSDSRVFGPIPEDNLQGAPCWIIWPPGDRLGAPPQAPYPFLNFPRMIIWIVFGCAAGIYYLYHRIRLRANDKNNH